MAWELSGRSVLITGAARGIGAGTARALAARGMRVALVGLEPEELARVSADCPGSIWVEADVRDREALASAAAQAVAAFGGLDSCLANAGIATNAFLHMAEPESFDRTIDVNLLGAWKTIEACLPHVIERRGYVCAVASAAALVHAPLFGAYAASKAGVEAMGDVLREELSPLGVDVGVAYFSWIKTDMVLPAYEHPSYARLRQAAGKPFDREYEADKAVCALVRGFERRSARIDGPGWLKGARLLRHVLQLVNERRLAREAPELLRLEQEELEARGRAAMSAPVGAGGDAVVASEREPA